MDVDPWARSAEDLEHRRAVPAALAAAWLLRAASMTWRGRVVPHTSMHDLTFTAPSDDYPYSDEVRVAWSDGLYEFSLLTHGGLVVSADRAREKNARTMLDSFLVQLVGGET